MIAMTDLFALAIVVGIVIGFIAIHVAIATSITRAIRGARMNPLATRLNSTRSRQTSTSSKGSSPRNGHPSEPQSRLHAAPGDVVHFPHLHS